MSDQKHASTRKSAGWAIALFAVGVLLYAYSFSQSFHIDDFIQLSWLDHKSLLEIWTANDRGYYRPTSFMLWKLVHLAYGYYQPAALHALNVASHALNGALVFALLMRVLPVLDEAARRRVSVLSALLFLAYPFSYQAVPWIGSLNHPLVVNFVLLALLMAYPRGDAPSLARRLAALAFTALAIVTHESGVMVGPLMVLIFAVQQPALPKRDWLKRAWPFFALGFALPVLIALLRQSPPAFTTVTMESRFQNSVYFLQGLVYSLAPLAAPLMRATSLSDVAAVLLVCVPAVLLLAGSLWRLGFARVALLAVGWYVIAIAPAVLLLPFDYVIDGPRLMYLSSIGAAVLLGAQVLWLDRQGASRLPRLFFGVALPASALIFSLVFLAQRADMYEQTRRLAEGLVREMRPAAEGKPALVVNFPSWFAPRQASYALGHEGVTFVPAYSGPADLLYLHTGESRLMRSVVLPHMQSEWRFNFANHGPSLNPGEIQPSLREFPTVLFASTKEHDAFITDAGSLESTNAPRSNTIATFSDTLQLLSQTTERLDAQRLRVTLRWQVLKPPAQDARTFVHLFSAEGNLVAQEDGWPLMNLADMRAWQAGDVWRDVRIIMLPAIAPAGRYTLRAGVYDAADGARFPAVDANGQPIADNSALLGEWAAP